MSVTASQVHPVAEVMPDFGASFRKKYGIAPKGPGPHPDSSYGFPLPPADHPNALTFAHAVLSRAHQASNFDPADVAKQVRRASAIVAKHNSKKESAKPWRSVAWVDTDRPNCRGGFVSVNPRQSETAKEFLARVPGARPKQMVEKVTAAAKSMLLARARGVKMRESAGVIERGETTLREDVRSNAAFHEAIDAGEVIKGVLLLREGPGNLGDRHYYTAPCIADAARSGVFEGAQSYLDHPTPIEEQNQPERSVKNLAAWYSNVTCREYRDPQLGRTVQGLFADMHLVAGRQDVASLVRTCVEYAKTYPRKSFAGLSIYASGDSAPGTIDGESWNIVNRITKAESVDIVTRAGAGGAIVPLKESQRMKTDAQNVKLVIDGEAVKTSVSQLLEQQKTQVKAKLKESGVTLSEDQEQGLDRALNAVDAGAIDKVLDDCTGLEEAKSSEEMPSASGASLDEADVDDMPDDPAALKAQLKKERAARKSAEAKAAESAGKVTEAQRQANTIVRERMIDEAMVERNIPETFRPGCKRYVLRETFSTKAQANELVNEFDLTYIRPKIDGAGVVGMRESAANAPKGGNFNFDGEG